MVWFLFCLIEGDFFFSFGRRRGLGEAIALIRAGSAGSVLRTWDWEGVQVLADKYLNASTQAHARPRYTRR